MLGLRWTFARGRLTVDLVATVVILVIVFPLLLLESLFLDLAAIDDKDDGSEDSVSVEVGENVFSLGFFAFLLLIFSSSSEEGVEDLDAALAFWLIEVVPKDGARFNPCRFIANPQYDSERLTRCTREIVIWESC
jgi:hypothetical protein